MKLVHSRYFALWAFQQNDLATTQKDYRQYSQGLSIHNSSAFNSILKASTFQDKNFISPLEYEPEVNYPTWQVASLAEARFQLIASLVAPGQNVVIAEPVHDEASNFAAFHQLGIHIRLAAEKDLVSLQKLTDSRTRLIFIRKTTRQELPLNALKKIVAFTRQEKIPLILEESEHQIQVLLAKGVSLVIAPTLPEVSLPVKWVIWEAGNYNWQNGKFERLFQVAAFRRSSKENEKENFGAFSLLEYLQGQERLLIQPVLTRKLLADLHTLAGTLKDQVRNAIAVTNWLSRTKRTIQNEAANYLLPANTQILTFRFVSSPEAFKLFTDMLLRKSYLLHQHDRCHSVRGICENFRND